MDLTTALIEFSELLDIAAKSLRSILRTEDGSAAARAATEEVRQIAARLREISEDLRAP